MDQAEVVRDLNRLVNDPKLEHRHRNIARNAIAFIREQEDKIAELEAGEGQQAEEAEDITKPNPSCDNCGYCVLHNSYAEGCKYVQCSKRGLRMMTLSPMATMASEEAVRKVIHKECAEYAEGCEYFLPIRKYA